MVDSPTPVPNTLTHLARSLDEVDPEVSSIIRKETEKQSRKLVMIASENYSSEAVLEA